MFALGLIIGANWPSRSRYAYYGLRVQRVVGSDSMDMISPETGPFRADFCPENHVSQYEPRAGYVLCKLQYVDRGCFDISKQKDGLWWVKDKWGGTATLSEQDTFQPWPKCQKDDVIAQGGN